MNRFYVVLTALAVSLLAVGESHAFGRRGGLGRCSGSTFGGCNVHRGCGVFTGYATSNYSPAATVYTGSNVSYSGYGQPRYSTPVTGLQPGQWIMTPHGWAQVISVGTPTTRQTARATTPKKIRRMPEPEEKGRKPKAPAIDD